MRQHSTSLKNFWLYVILSEAKNLADSDRVTILFSSLMMLFIISGCSATQAEKPIEFIVPIAEPTRAPATESAPMPAPTAPQKISEYSTLDFLSDYLTNRTYPNLIDAKAWINSSLNLAQWREQNGGTTFWDFWGDDEQWETTNHQWQDDAGAWHLYSRATITARDGKNISAYVLVDRPGPGAMDLLYFVHDTIIWRGDVLQHLAILGARGVEDVVQWGNLQKLGNLRIEVDNEIIFDGAIREWFSGAAQNLSPDLVKIFAWRYQDFGSSGNIIPIPYQQRLRVFLYGGDAKPKWFMATGVTFPRETRVVPYRAADLPIQEFARRALNVLQPETYLDARENVTMRALRAQLDAPARIELNGAGTVEAIQFRIAKNFDPRPLWLRVNHGDETGIDLPFTAFFSDPDQIVAHRSAPIGVMDNGNEYLFYSNFPMPFQNGMTIEISTNRSTAVPITARFARSNELSASQLRVAYTEAEKLRALSPDYQVKIKGDGKLIGIILATKDQDFKNVVTRNLPNTKQEDPATHSWTLGYLEANLKIEDGAGNARVYSGHEDWAGGGYYFNLGYTTPSGGANRAFGGILRFKDAEDGYATIYRYFNDLSAFRFKNGLTLSFGHGTWRNNFPVTFGSTVLYYGDSKQ